jgi:hypothetical protein
MQDFSSISVSSYEAGVLADRLTEQSREGWEVVAIVPTGSTVTAYLSRSSGQASHGGGSAEVAAAVVEPDPVPAEAAVEHEPEAVEDEPEVVADEPELPAADSVDESDAEQEADAEAQAAADTLIDEIEPEPVEDEGWAALVAEVAESEGEIVPSLPEAAPDAAAAAVADVAIEPEPASAEPEVAEAAPAAEATVEPAADAAAASGAAPAGWYADPSARFELRYWDGAQWTEHVSRAGQQYTDPPVA